MVTVSTNAPPRLRASHLPLFAILGLGLSLRLGLAFAAWQQGGLAAFHAGDTDTYLAPARSLLVDGSFSRLGEPMLLRTPGYSLFLIPGLLTGHVELVTVALQIGLSLAGVVLVYRLAGQIVLDRSCALAAAALVAIEPLSCTYASLLITETLFAFLLVLAMLALVGYLRGHAVLDLLMAALLLTAATFVRPISYYLPLAIAVLLLARELWAWRHSGSLRVAHVAVFLAACGIPLSLWQARNDRVAGYQRFAAIGDWNLYFFQGASLLAREQHKPLEQVQIELGYGDGDRFERLHPELRGRGQTARFDYMHAEGARLVREYWREYAPIHLRGFAVLALNPAATDACSLVGRYDASQRKPRPVGAGVVDVVRAMHRDVPHLLYANLILGTVLAVAYALAAIGAAAQARRLDWPLVMLAATACYLLALSGGPACVARLRHPVMPLVAILAGIGWSVLMAFFRQRRAPIVSPLEPATLRPAPSRLAA